MRPDAATNPTSNPRSNPTTNEPPRIPPVGPAELRRNRGALLRRAAKGERLEITDRGRPVAPLVPTRAVTPVTPGMTPFERLVAEGRAATPPGPVLPLPPPEGEISTMASDAVIAAPRGRLP